MRTFYNREGNTEREIKMVRVSVSGRSVLNMQYFFIAQFNLY